MVVLGPAFTPDDARIAVREATYPNKREEQAAIDAVEQQVLQKTILQEQAMVDQAHMFTERIQVECERAEEIRVALKDEIRYALAEDPHIASRQMAKRYTTLKRNAESQIATLESAAKAAETQADKCEDPYAQLSLILQKYPALRNGKRL